ncbi:MAG: hypothetical protein JNL79_28900 [Myxococcales bacterium]|nr:hypothetical protein [Myxococcales bacterium]
MRLASLLAPFTLGSPRRRARLLAAFARAEHASMLDLRLAAAATTSPARKAAYLSHALDEERHARTFAAAARENGGGEPVLGDAEDLFARRGELGFLAFVHHGESRGRRQFAALSARAERLGDARLATTLAAIATDEAQHESYTGALLVELAGEAGARKALRRARAWEAWRTFRRAGRAMAGVVWTVSMTLLYFALLPFVLLVLVARPARRGLVPR